MHRLAILIAYSLSAFAQAPEPPPLPSVAGRVLNAITGDAVAKASLTLEHTGAAQTPDDWTRNYGATSDAFGKFTLNNIEPGKYRLQVSRNGFISPQRSPILDLTAAQQLKNIELRLTPQGLIAGRVLDADGDPVPQAPVQLLRSRYVSGRKQLSAISVTYTNDIGEYRFPSLTPAGYYIYAQDVEGPLPTSTAHEQYVGTYYPGAVGTSGALPISVAAGRQATGVDVVLHKAAAVTVKGRVAVDLPGAHGTPSVRFSSREGHDTSALGINRSPVAKTDAEGHFEIHSLTPGAYTAMAEVSRGGIGFTGVTNLNVGGTDIEGVVLTIGNGVSITGILRVDGDATLDPGKATVKLQFNGPLLDSSSGGWTTHIAAGGAFHMDNLSPRRWGIVIENLADGFYTKSIRAGELDALYSGIDLASGASAQIEVVVSPGAGVVSGAALNPDTGTPGAGATVVLIPTDKKRLAVGMFYRNTVTDQYGKFTLKNIAPGDYKLFAWADVEPTAWLDPDFMKPFEEKGTPVTVTEGRRTGVQANLIPAASEKAQ